MFKPLVVLGCLLLASTASYAEEYFEPIVKEERAVFKNLIKEIGFKEADVRLYKTNSKLKKDKYDIKSQLLYRERETNYEWVELKKKKKYFSISGGVPKSPNVVINSTGNIISINIKLNKIPFENTQHLSFFKELLALSVFSDKGCNDATIKNLPKLKIEELSLGCNENISFPDLLLLTNLENLYMDAVDMKDVSIPKINSLKYMLVDVNENLNNLDQFKHLNHLEVLRLSLEKPQSYHIDIDWFTNMKKLKKLEIFGSTTVNNISSLGSLKQLKSLSLILHSVQSLDGLSKLTELETINLYMHKLNKMPSLNHMKKLKILEFSETQLTSLDFIQGASSLVTLDVSYSPIHSLLPVMSLINLESLSILKSKIKKIEGLDNMTKLKKFRIKDSPVTKIEGLDNLISLEELNLDRLKINKLENMESLKNLKTFFVPYFHRTKENFEYLKTLENRDVLLI